MAQPVQDDMTARRLQTMMDDEAADSRRLGKTLWPRDPNELGKQLADRALAIAIEKSLKTQPTSGQLTASL
jgi:hypothetical protein